MKMPTNKPASFIARSLAIAVLLAASITLNGCSSGCLTMPEVPLGKVNNATFTSLLMVTPNEGWAVGLTNTMLHYKDGQWTALAIPNFMRGLAKVSDSELWAVGGQSYMMHYQNGCWQQDNSLVNFDPLNDVQPSLNDIYMLSKNEGWAVGDRVAHYQNGSWKVTNGIGGYGLDMLSASEGWAVGYLGTISHYKDDTWQMVAWPEQEQIQIGTSASTGGAALRRVKMVSAGEGWAVGDSGFIVHYTNGQWRRAESPTNYTISDLQMLSANDGWAASDTLLHYTGGKWQRVDSPAVTTLYMLSADEGWAIGRSILHYQNGKWQEVEKLGGQ